MLSLEEKSKRYDEIQSWFWWVRRRTYNNKTNKKYIRLFLKGISEYLEDYKEG